jgi:hypothetical protein
VWVVHNPQLDVRVAGHQQLQVRPVRAQASVAVHHLVLTNHPRSWLARTRNVSSIWQLDMVVGISPASGLLFASKNRSSSRSPIDCGISPSEYPIGVSWYKYAMAP